MGNMVLAFNVSGVFIQDVSCIVFTNTLVEMLLHNLVDPALHSGVARLQKLSSTPIVIGCKLIFGAMENSII